MSYYVCCVSYNNDKCDRSTYTKEEQGMRVIFSYKNFKQYMGGGAEVEGGEWTIYKITSPRVFHVRIETSPEKTGIPRIFVMSNMLIATYQVQKDQMQKLRKHVGRHWHKYLQAR